MPDRPPIQPAKLREAREYIGFTVAEIAAALGWEPSVLERIEAGSTTITGEQIGKLCRIYRRPLEWFTGEFRFEPDPALLRMVEGKSEIDREAILEFAEFLQCAGPAPKIARARPGASDG